MNYVSLSAWLPACLSGLSESLPLTPMNQRLTPMHPGLTPGPTIATPISTSAGGRGKARLHTGGRPAAMASYPPATEGKCYKGIWGEGWEVGGKGQESSTTLAHGRAGHTQGILGGATEKPYVLLGSHNSLTPLYFIHGNILNPSPWITITLKDILPN